MNRIDGIEWLARLVFGVIALIHLLPLAGILGRSVIERAYGVSLGADQDVVILMQHRALLFGILAAACVGAVVWPSWRWPVGLAAGVSTLGFVVIAAMQAHNAPIARVMWVDIGAVILLLIWCAAQLLRR
jgi:hypothetical protein